MSWPVTDYPFRASELFANGDNGDHQPIIEVSF